MGDEAGPDEPVKLLGGAVYLSLTRNSGAAFSLCADYTFIFPIIALVVLTWIGFMARKLRSLPWAIALGLILGGALGNLIDRIFRAPGPFHGHVVDFISLFDPHGQVFPIFNVADMALVCGVILAVLLELLGRQRDGTGLRRPSAGDRRRDPAVRRGPRSAGALPAGPRRAGRDAAGPGGLPAVRAVPHRGRHPGRIRRRARRRRARAKSDKVNGGQLAGGDPARRRPRRPAVVAEPVDGLQVIYSDDDIVVVDKPVGVAAHPSPGWTGPTVIGGLAAMGHTVATSGAAERQGVVHRLDVGTTGLMVVAKSETAYSALKRAFKEREVDKRYHAVVQGQLDPLRGTVDAPIDRHPTHDCKFAVMSGGKPSVTHYDTLEAFPSASLVDIRLETGRTHQIRVHFSALRHPCVGDLTYGADPTLAARLGLTPAVAARP